ncbi:sensor histidine kinase [Simiduia aestuariiviva]|uniref:histidine kinase n=1 Tax=Simiduia aestuariiviva TaxID=1510459 RepID=A0A839UMZ1_9GAMM|nr:HAMP domain-containing sensor histidine kinase [Simiduia aestuariiviva]MBB3167116.1 signal transduction histidine kinase [Simiduia aestuariiviva]
MADRPLHRTIFLSFASIITGVCVLFAALSLLLAYIVEDGILDAMLTQQAAALAGAPVVDGDVYPVALAPGVRWIQAVEQAPALVREQLALNPNISEVHTPDSSHYHVRRLDGQRGWLVAEVSGLLVVSQLSGVWFAVLSVFWILALAVALWLAYLSARRATQPLRDILHEYQTQPLPDAPGDSIATDLASNELHQLATQLSDINRAYRDALAREQAFTRDISHELRTPLTVLQNQLALLAQSMQVGNKRGAPLDDSCGGGGIEAPRDTVAWARMQTAVGEAVHLLDMLLALARQESLPTQPLPVLALVEQAIVDAAEYAPGLCITLDCAKNAEAVRVDAHQRPVLLLFKNLIQNAQLHGSDQGLLIELTNADISFNNACRATAASTGSGMQQGLSLSARLAEAMNWKLRHEVAADRFLVRVNIR